MRRDPCEDIGRSLDLEVKRSRLIHTYQNLKGSGTPDTTKSTTSRGDLTSNFTSTSSLNRGVLKRKKNKNVIHFTAESSDVELLFRIIHSAHQLSVNGAVSSWIGQPSPAGAEPTSRETVDEETTKSVNPEQVNSLVDSARSWYASGNRAQDDLHDIQLMDIPHCTARIL